MKDRGKIARERLMNLMKGIKTGRIERLTVVEGKPIFNPFPGIIRTINFNDETVAPKDSSIIEGKMDRLFKCIGNIELGMIQSLEIKNGEPVVIHIEENI
ncbi:MAG: hypothetical protein HQK78_03145 [Desulfobacterales bacterium]|nr:hypothetical protein [Desulfobacterales bacterium]